jgi:hypothetical protein
MIWLLDASNLLRHVLFVHVTPPARKGFCLARHHVYAAVGACILPAGLHSLRLELPGQADPSQRQSLSDG